MNILTAAVVVYLAIGIVALAILDIKTKRLRSRLASASQNTQILVGGRKKIATVVTLIALFVFWPAAVYAAIAKPKKGDEDGA